MIVSDDSGDKKRLFQQLFQRGNEALNKQNWGYAVEMFMNCIKLDPENQQARLSLRLSQRKVYGDNGKGAKMASMKLMGPRGKVKKARGKEDWNAMDHAAEEGLCINPWDAQLNADVGEANEARGYLQIARLGYQWAVEVDVNNKEFLKKLGGVCEQLGDYKKAIVYWDKIYKMDPMDSDARAKVTQLHAESMIDRGGYDEAEGTRDVKKQSAYDDYAPTAGQTQQEVIGPGQSDEADLRRQIRKNPEEVPVYLKLAALLKDDKRLEESREILQQALQVSGGDPNIQEQLEDIELDLMRNNLEIARHAAAENPDDEVAKENTVALAQELIKREIAVYNARIERYPRDNKLKVELAERYAKVKHYDKAIPLLQKASADQRYAGRVGVMLGKCFMGVKKGSLAISALTRAIPQINSHDQQDLFCEANYLLGRLYEGAKDFANAEKHYNEVIAIDYEFKDTVERLERIQGGGEGGGAGENE